MRRFSASGHNGPASLVAVQAAQGRVNAQDIGIEIESTMLGADHDRARSLLGFPSANVAAVASGPASEDRQRPIGAQKNLKYRVDEAVSGVVDVNGKEKIAKGIMQAASKQFGGLVSRFRNRIREYEKRVDFARDEHERWNSEKSVLQERIEDLEFEAQDLRDQMTSAMSSMKGPQTLFIGKRHKPNIRQTMQKLGSDMTLDVDIDGMEQDTGIHRHVSMGGVWKRFGRRVYRLQQQWMPLQRDVKLISSRYGRACGGFFKFHRFVGCLSLVMCILCLPLYIPHVLSEGSQLFRGSCGKLPVACAWLYSGFYRSGDSENRDPWLAFRYLGVLVISSVACLSLSIFRWSSYDLSYQIEKVNEDLQPRRWSKMVLIAWDFRLHPGEDRRHWQHALTNQLRSMYDDDMAQKVASQRTRLGWYLLYSRRALGLFLNASFILAAWGGICWATVKRYEIEDTVSSIFGGSVGSQIASFAPNMVVAAVGLVLPFITKWITYLEGWGPVTMASQNMWRLFLGRIVNIFIFVAICVELLVNRPLFGQQKVLMQRDTDYECVEDQAAVRLLSLVASEFVLSLALKPFTILLSDAIYAAVFHAPFEMSPFEIADYAVDIIYFQCLLWATVVFVPTVVFLAPMLLFGHFKWLKSVLLNLSSRPFVAETSKLCVSQLQIHCVACVLFMAFVTALATTSLPHANGCGPFNNWEKPYIMLKDLHWDFPGKAGLSTFGKFILQNPQIIFGVAALIFLLSFFGRNRIKALQIAISQLQQASQRHVEALEGELWRMERQNELLNRRVQWQEY